MVTLFFFSSRRRHTRYIGDWSSDVCSSDLCDRLAARLPEGLRHARDIVRCPDRARAGDPRHAGGGAELRAASRSEERRVGKECRSRWSQAPYTKDSSTTSHPRRSALQKSTL